MPCFKRSATTDDWKTDFENTYAMSYISASDHSDGGPKISKIVESFKKYDVFKYAAYRMAFKLRTVQKASKLHLVNLAVIGSVLKQCGCDSQSLEETLSGDKVKDVILALYTEASKHIGFAADLNVMTRLFCAFLQNAFVEKENPILLAQMKIALTLFSSAKLSEKYKYMFYHCSSDNVMSKKGLQILLKTLSKIAEVVGEQVTFGSHLVPAAVQNCLKHCKGKITEKRFRKWLSLDPQTLVWISTLHRIAISETTEHFIQCDHCLASPTSGLRYKCLQCLNYNLCQNCFLRGYYNKGHKEGHFMQEFCQPASVWQEAKTALNAFKNKVTFARCPSKSYLSFDEESVNDSTVLINDSVQKLSTSNQSFRKGTPAYIIKELTSIISQLDEEQKQIAALENINENEKGQSSTPNPSTGKQSNRNSLTDFNSHLSTQLERLRDLLKCLKTPDSAKKEMGIVSPVPHVPLHNQNRYFESTPLNSGISSPLQAKENHPEFAAHNFSSPTSISEKQRGCSSEYSRSFSYSEKENFTFTTTYEATTGQSGSLSLELTDILNNSSPKNLSTKLSELNGDVSKLSPLYVYSSIDLEDHPSEVSSEMKSEFTPSKSMNLRSSKLHKSTFTLDKDGKLEIMEKELQAMLLHLEELLPQVSILANDSKIEKDKVVSALSEMEEAIEKLSHLSFDLSTGSTDL